MKRANRHANDEQQRIWLKLTRPKGSERMACLFVTPPHGKLSEYRFVVVSPNRPILSLSSLVLVLENRTKPEEKVVAYEAPSLIHESIMHYIFSGYFRDAYGKQYNDKSCVCYFKLWLVAKHERPKEIKIFKYIWSDEKNNPEWYSK